MKKIFKKRKQELNKIVKIIDIFFGCVLCSPYQVLLGYKTYKKLCGGNYKKIITAIDKSGDIVYFNGEEDMCDTREGTIVKIIINPFVKELILPIFTTEETIKKDFNFTGNPAFQWYINHYKIENLIGL